MRRLVAICVIALTVLVLYGTLFCPQVRRQLLANRIRAMTKIRFTCPPGHVFALAFGYGRDHVSVSSLRGRLIVDHDGTAVQQFDIDDASLDQANWLESDGLSALVLKSDNPNRHLKVSSGQTYEITVQIDDAPAAPVSLWLCYLTTRYQELRTYVSAP
jgi:hypothetical protein